METFLPVAASVLVVLSAAVMGFFIFKRQKSSRIRASLSLKLLLIKLPQSALQKEGSSFKEEINVSEQLLGILAGNQEEAVFEMAVHHIGEEIHFYVAVPERLAPFISRQIEGLFKDVQIEEAHEYNVFQPGGCNAGFYLKQDAHYSMPLRTYLEADSDTFSPIISSFSKINEVGEGAALQIMVRRVDPGYKKSIFNIIESMRKGAKFSDVASAKLLEMKDLAGVFKAPQEKKDDVPAIIDQNTIQALEKKISKPLLSVNIRIVVSAVTQYQADAIATSIAGSFSQFESPMRNKLKVVKVRDFRQFAYQFTFREFAPSQAMVLNTEELASIFHMPSSSTLSPKIKWLRSKEAVPPAELPEAGTKIGESVFRGTAKPVYVTDADRRRHVYVIGQTGTGKSALITNMALDDISKGKGVCVIDPHGDLVDSILSSMPPERANDVIIFDPGHIQKPIGLNMLEYDINNPQEKTFIVNEIQSIFNRLFTAETMGPMFEQYMRNALLLLMEDAVNEPSTLIEVPRIFTDDAFRKKKLDRITNPVVLDFWLKEATKVGGEASLNNMAPYITSKFNNFIANDFVRPIIGQTKSSFNFRSIMDERKILLVSLSKGKIGELNSGLLGMIIVGKLLLSAFSRVDIPEDQRADFNLYIDEFQNFTTDSISTILSEARKYHLNLTIAHQFIAQLTEKIRDSVFGNVGSMIVFRIGAQDADFLVKQFEPVFSQNDLMNIDNLNAYVKLLIKGLTSKPFNIRTPLYPKQSHETGDKIKELAFLKYGADRQTVESGILQRLRS
jgi:hypothetical protein